MLLKCMNEGIREAGCDEAGRGCLAGPVVAAAVILPRGFGHPLLNDSKKLKEHTRDELRLVIEEYALAWGVAMVDEKEIDRINILNASILAMHRAIAMLSTRPSFLLIDGNRFSPVEGIPHECIVKGDGKYASIAAASVLAKTHRDEYMKVLHEKDPRFRWDRNKGYPTREHRRAIAEYGPTVHHRQSFRLLDEQLSLSFS